MHIRTGTIEEIVALSGHIPELTDPYGAPVYYERLAPVPHLILLAVDAGIPVGFKVGYQREKDGSFYSWMGGVLPEYRRKHVARQLAQRQEAWARENGYTSIIFKTRNRHKAMLIFALKNGFQITAVEPMEAIEEYRIWLRKEL
jgi:GNAT superfamily N-acetyltransferase